MTKYTDTTSQLARDAEVTPPTIRLYADMDLLDYVVASNGVRLFCTGQAARVREIYRARMAHRGRKAG